METVRQLLYVSNTSRALDEASLNAILETARRNNTARAITGILLYLDGAFLQVLEGQADVIDEIYRRITSDPRHWETQLLLDRPAPRAFGAWSMGFERLDGPGRDGAFALTLDRALERIHAESLRDLPALVKTFCRIHGGGQDPA